MKNLPFQTLIILFLLAGATLAIALEFYVSWFRPADFMERSKGRVKNWWPFARYFRTYYASSTWLWIIRIASAVALLFILFAAFEVLYHLSGSPH